MASGNKCSVCNQSGTCICAGCNKYFCRKDFNDHHETLVHELDVILEDRNELQDKINKTTGNKDYRSPLLAEIDEWERITIGKVKQIAEQTRQQAMTLLNSKRTEMIAQFDTFSKELVQLKKTEDIVEHDLERMKGTVRQLNENLKQLSQTLAIQLHTEQSDRIDWHRLIYVEAKTNDTISRIPNQEVNG